MELVLLIHIRHWDSEKKRFRSEAFEPSSDGSGISVVDATCARESSGSICDHARKYYPSVSSEPPIFWQFHFPGDPWPTSVALDESPSDSGDHCHRNLRGIAKKPAK